MQIQDRFPEEPAWLQGRSLDHLFVFTHIEKAAGTSFTSYLGKIYGRHLGLRYGKWSTPIVVDELEQMPFNSARDLYAFSSHLPFGVERRFARNSDQAARDEIARKKIFRATILRDPAERFYSGFRYIQSTPKNPRHEVVANMTFSEFLDLELRRTKHHNALNLMCWMITGRRGATFSEAKESLLQNYDVVAVVQRSEDLIEALQDLLGWPPDADYEMRNKTPNKPAALVDEIETARAQGFFDDDQKLFDFVEKSSVLLGRVRQNP